MSSCRAGDLVPYSLTPTALVTRAAPDCPYERCYNAEHGLGPECHPGECHYRGKPGPRGRCPIHDVPGAGPGVEAREVPPQVLARRREAVARLVDGMKAFLAVLHEQLLAGGLAGCDYDRMESMQRWLGDLLAERDAPPPPPPGGGGPGRAPAEEAPPSGRRRKGRTGR